MVNAGEMMSFKYYARGLITNSCSRRESSRLGEKEVQVQPIQVGILTMWK
jgi:hypothetical protein